MSTKIGHTIEFGDFQTPDTLARGVCKTLHRLGVSPESIVEPTCGKGSFLRASVDAFPECTMFLGFEINSDYVETTRTIEKVDVHCEDFFNQNWSGTLDRLREPILVVGNPPWVTNSAVGTLGGRNLPFKTNFQNFSGLDAITGKSNFDISEWMLLHLLERLSGRQAVLAMLCKTVVARKVLRHVWSRSLHVATSAIYLIDAAKFFGVSVDACLLVCILEPEATSRECAVYPDLEASAHDSTFALRSDHLVADLDAFNAYGHLSGISPLKWRSGVKHDCSRVMELRLRGNGSFENGFGEAVNIELDYLYPMLKSSELMKPHPAPTRYMIVTQRSVGEDTSQIKRNAPRTWDYLQSHASLLDGRASIIYKNRPRFSVFGIGPYSFAPWKVAISGFYKRLDFRCIGPVDDKPVLLDDTCYFLPCHTEDDARLLANMVNSRSARGFFHSLIFWDAKRPVTVQLLGNLDLALLAKEAGISLPAWSDVALFGENRTDYPGYEQTGNTTRLQYELYPC